MKRLLMLLLAVGMLLSVTISANAYRDGGWTGRGSDPEYYTEYCRPDYAMWYAHHYGHPGCIPPPPRW